MKFREWLIKKLGGVLPSINQPDYRTIEVNVIGAPANREETQSLYDEAARRLGSRLYEKDAITWIVESNTTDTTIKIRALIKVKN